MSELDETTPKDAAAAKEDHDAAIAPHDQALKQAIADAESSLLESAHTAAGYEDVIRAVQTCDQAFRDAQSRYDDAVRPIKQRFEEATAAAGRITTGEN